MGTYTKNADGLARHYGTRDTDHLARAEGDNHNTVVMTIHGESVPADPAASDATKAQYVRGAVIPSGAQIVTARLVVTEAFTSASSTGTLTVGTYNADSGAALDADGIDATVALSGVLDTVGTVVTCDGADVAGAALTAAASIACLWGTKALTAGTARLEVTYIVPNNTP